MWMDIALGYLVICTVMSAAALVVGYRWNRAKYRNRRK